MKTSTTPEIVGYKATETLGDVSGQSVRTRHLLREIRIGLRELFGGQSKGREKSIQKAKEAAKEQAIEEAKKKGADGLINIKYDVSVNMNETIVLCSGTAVKLASALTAVKDDKLIAKRA